MWHVSPTGVRQWGIGRWLATGAVLAAVLAVILVVVTRARASAPSSLARMVGTAAPVLSLPAEQGGLLLARPQTIGGATGHPQVIVFFFTLCPQCLGEVHELVGATNADALAGARVVYVDSPAERPDIVDAYAAREGLGAPILLDRTGQAARAYHVAYFPSIVLVDATGKVRAVWYGTVSSETLRDAVAALPTSSR